MPWALLLNWLLDTFQFWGTIVCIDRRCLVHNGTQTVAFQCYWYSNCWCGSVLSANWSLKGLDQIEMNQSKKENIPFSFGTVFYLLIHLWKHPALLPLAIPIPANPLLRSEYVNQLAVTVLGSFLHSLLEMSSITGFHFNPFYYFFLQRSPQADSPGPCELLPALERRDGLSGSSSLYHMDLSKPDTLDQLSPDSSMEVPSQPSPSSRTFSSRTANGKRTMEGSLSSNPLARKVRRRTADRPPLAQHNVEKKQKESNNVSQILQQHNKTTVCVCWN